MKSAWHAWRIALRCVLVGWRGGEAVLFAAGGAAGAACFGAGADGALGAGAGAGVGDAVVGAALGAAAGATGAAAGVGAGVAAGAGFGAIAETAPRHAADRLAEWLCRHWKASMPPGETLIQCAMKSERQLLRIAAFCASVGCCASAASAPAPSTSAARIAFRTCLHVLDIAPPNQNFRVMAGLVPAIHVLISKPQEGAGEVAATPRIKPIASNSPAARMMARWKCGVEVAGYRLAQVHVYSREPSHFVTFKVVNDRYFGGHNPARIFVPVPSWPGPFDAEIDCMAVVEGQ